MTLVQGHGARLVGGRTFVNKNKVSKRRTYSQPLRKNNWNFGKKLFDLAFNTRTGHYQRWPGLVIVIVDRLGLLGSEGLKKVVTITFFVLCFLPTNVEVNFHNISISSIQSSHHFHFHIEVMMVKILKKEWKWVNIAGSMGGGLCNQIRWGQGVEDFYNSLLIKYRISNIRVLPNMEYPT